MMMHTLLMAVGLLMAADPSKEDAADTAVKKLEGTWITHDVMVGGNKSGGGTTKLVIKGNRLSWSIVQKSGKGIKLTETTFSYTLNPTRTPQEMDLVALEGRFKGKVYPSIYLLDGDTIKLCRAGPGEKRPTKFRSQKGSTHWFLMLKRESGPATGFEWSRSSCPLSSDFSVGSSVTLGSTGR